MLFFAAILSSTQYHNNDSRGTPRWVVPVLIAAVVATTSQGEVLLAKSGGAYGDVYGNVGGQYVSLFLNGKSGYYTTDDCGRRTVKIVSYTGNYLVLKAYLRGKFIGTSGGSCEKAWKNYIGVYEGKFKSVSGESLNFYLYNTYD